jgi:hypothetical protein
MEELDAQVAQIVHQLQVLDGQAEQREITDEEFRARSRPLLRELAQLAGGSSRPAAAGPAVRCSSRGQRERQR